MINKQLYLSYIGAFGNRKILMNISEGKRKKSNIQSQMNKEREIYKSYYETRAYCHNMVTMSLCALNQDPQKTLLFSKFRYDQWSDLKRRLGRYDENRSI